MSNFLAKVTSSRFLLLLLVAIFITALVSLIASTVLIVMGHQNFALVRHIDVLLSGSRQIALNDLQLRLYIREGERRANSGL